jgi:hypothetical protein
LAAACRKVYRHATVAWLKRKVFTRSGTQEIYGLQKELAIDEMRTTSHARAAWGKEMSSGKIGPENRENKKSRKDERTGRVRKHFECNSGLRDVGLKQQLRGWKRIKDLGVRLPLCPKKKRTNGFEVWSAGYRSYMRSGGQPSKTPYEIFGGKITKQVVGNSCRLRRIKKWILWRSRPPLKRKKKLRTE